jgi:hypothetical protein
MSIDEFELTWLRQDHIQDTLSLTELFSYQGWHYSANGVCTTFSSGHLVPCSAHKPLGLTFSSVVSQQVIQWDFN